MTLLAALMPDRDSVYLGADSGLLEIDEEAGFGVTTTSTGKFRRVRDLFLMWGFTGHSRTGHPFGRWLNQQTISSWPALAESAQVQLAIINRRERTLNRIADIEPPKFSKITKAVVIGGFVKGESNLLLVPDGGTSELLSESDVEISEGAALFIGLANGAVNFGWNVAPILSDDLVDPVDRFNVFCTARSLM